MEGAMAKTRSPNYPQMDLGAALQAAQSVYKAEDRNKMSKEVLAKHLGYSSLSGRALSKIGALRAYGIIEGTGDELRVSEDAIIALEAPRDNSDRTAALRSMATRPEIFSDIAANFEGKVSKENLRYWLTRRGFMSDAASKAADTYLATMELVPELDNEYASENVRDEHEATQDTKNKTEYAPTSESLSRGSASPSSMRRAVFPLEEGDVELIFPADMSQEGYSELSDYLEIFLKKEKRSRRKAQGDGRSGNEEGDEN